MDLPPLPTLCVTEALQGKFPHELLIIRSFLFLIPGRDTLCNGDRRRKSRNGKQAKDHLDLQDESYPDLGLGTTQ